MDQLGDGTEVRRVQNSTGGVSYTEKTLAPYTEKIGSHRVDRTLVTW